MTKSAGELIFSKYFNVEMYEYDAVDETMIGRRGSFTTGSPYLDQMASKRRTRVWRTINQLLDLYQAGSEFTMVDGMKAITQMHEIIQEHIHDVEMYMKSMASNMYSEDPEVTQERLRDLQSLDELGRHIYNKVRTSKMPEVHSVFRGYIDFSPTLIKPASSIEIKRAADYIPVTERIKYAPVRKRNFYK
ncbi:hypothetical protein [Serratia phage vB_SmaM_Yaphecito]|uniref:Uncharacterized protein n=1 Tax=Serratia phage vB_SmaM_Yaphecito TaxID=2777368 RepID=A0A7T3NBK5_9CAUD|nr:hypothetical protein [Serratia phage vB_SmaM_Yaphecito]